MTLAKRTIFCLTIVASMLCLNSCATIFGGRITNCQKTKPAIGEPRRQIRYVALVSDVILGFSLFQIPIVTDFSNGAIYKPCNRSEDIKVLDLHQSVPKGSKYLGNIEVDRQVISETCDYNSVISKAINKAKEVGGNVIKITELKFPNWSTMCYALKADILFNDSLKAIQDASKLRIANNIANQNQKDTTTSFSRFKIIVNPTLMLGQKEFGGLFEYRIKKHIAFEVGGGANINYNYPWETFSGYVAGEGFTIRAGMRIYSKSGFYFNPIIFYRQMKYHDRYYKWDRNGYSQQYEPGMMSCHCSGDSRLTANVEIGDEYKQVFAFEALAGKEFREGRMIIDLYTGLGVRYKYKKKEIVHSYSYLYSLNSGTYYNPPKEENLYGYLPTIQVGFQIGFLSKPKRYLHVSK